MNKADLLALLDAADRRRTALLVTNLKTHEQKLLLSGDPIPDLWKDAVDRAMRNGQSGTVVLGSEEYYFLVRQPSFRLFIIGAVHIAQALAPMARMAGFDVEIIDPRRAFANKERFPDIPISSVWPEEFFRDAFLDDTSALVALTHDPKIDDPALIAALQSSAFYIGALGSKKTHAARVTRLENIKGTERIHGPIGLPIGAKSPGEIAVSILAEMIAARRISS